jgi:catechol 2,3-dioxygenase-like lactoylglutathione lyase family enzyme
VKARLRPGPKPKHLYVRVVRAGIGSDVEFPTPRIVRPFLEHLEDVGRLVAHGHLTAPDGDLLVYRARDVGEARRVLRTDPFAEIPLTSYEILEWSPLERGSGVNLDPPPPRGSGRLTSLQRVAVVVRDQKEATRWYQEILGLTVRSQDLATDYVELSLGLGTSAISLIAPRADWGEPYYSEARGRIGAATGIVFQTDSVEALELRLRHAHATVTQSVREEPWGGSTVRFADPDGNEFLAFESPFPRLRAPARPARRP